MDKTLTIIVIALIAVFAAIYVYYFIRSFQVGLDRDLGKWTLLFSNLLLSPIIAYGFAKSTKKDSDRIKAVIRDTDAGTVATSLSYIIEAAISVDKILDITDISGFCRFCGEKLMVRETVCMGCNKKAVGYYLSARSSLTNKKHLVELNQWKSLTGDSIILEVKRVGL